MKVRVIFIILIRKIKILRKITYTKLPYSVILKASYPFHLPILLFMLPSISPSSTMTPRPT